MSSIHDRTHPCSQHQKRARYENQKKKNYELFRILYFLTIEMQWTSLNISLSEFFFSEVTVTIAYPVSIWLEMLPPLGDDIDFVNAACRACIDTPSNSHWPITVFDIVQLSLLCLSASIDCFLLVSLSHSTSYLIRCCNRDARLFYMCERACDFCVKE